MAFTNPEQGKVEMRFDSTGALYARSNSVTEVTVAPAGGAAGGAFAYNGTYGLYGANNDNTVSDYAVQIGSGASGSGSNYSVTIGKDSSTATSQKAVNIGVDNIVSGASQSVTVGSNQRNTGQYSIAIGWYSYVNRLGGQGGIAIGNSANSDYFGTGTSIAIGQSVQAAYGSLAMGKSARAMGLYSIAIGENADSSGARAVALGNQVNNTIADSFKFGVSATENINFDTWIPVVSAATASTHVIPILVNGVRHNILTSTA